MSRKIDVPNLDHLLKRYIAGEPEQKLAREAGINRWTFRQRILEAGIIPRNLSDSMYIRWAEATPEQRNAMLNNAHASTRGRVVTDQEKVLRAQSIEAALCRSVPTERFLADALQTHGLTPTLQKAIWIYNIDVALDIDRVAVEIFGGQWHTSGDHARRFHKRTKYLLDSGWHVVIIWVDGRHYPLGAGAIDYVVTFVKELRSHPPASSQYRVILGDGQLAPIAQRYFNSPTDIERLGGGVDSAGR